MKHQPEDKEQPKMPEFIIIDDKEHAYSGEEFPRFKKTPPKQTSWKIRAACLLGSILTLLWTVGALFFFFCMGAATLITFNYFPLLKRLAKLYWSWFKGGTVVTVGLVVSFFNFSLGIIFVIYYFSQTQEDWQKNMFTRVMYPHMKDYM
jgi:hypothetical protein